MRLLTEAEQLKPAFMKGVDKHFTEVVNSLIANSVLLESSPAAFPEKDSLKIKGTRAPPDHGKVFIPRKSLLDELFEVNHIRTIYHMFIALLVLFILSTLVVDYIDEGRLVLEFDFLVYSFGKISIVAPTWLCMFFSTLLVPYVLFVRWAQGFHSSSHKIIYSTLFGALFVIFQTVCLGFGPIYIVLVYDLPPASRFIIILEQILGSLFYGYYIFVRLCIPMYRNYSLEHFSLRGLVLCIFNSILPVQSCPHTKSHFSTCNDTEMLLKSIHSNAAPEGVLIMFLTFFAFLHCWLNAFAEGLRFADRMFYKDWWNSTSFSNYYRTWNIVVHDWLYYYAYRDFLWFFGKKFKAVAMLSVFVVSAAVHEYILAICLGYLYPVMFFLFLCFGGLAFVNSDPEAICDLRSHPFFSGASFEVEGRVAQWEYLRYRVLLENSQLFWIT
ncbi:hypothetical protein Chor_003337 [Crotalus horridus]